MNRFKYASRKINNKYYPESGDVYVSSDDWAYYMVNGASDNVMCQLVALGNKKDIRHVPFISLKMHFKYMGLVGGRLWTAKENNKTYTVCYDTDMLDGKPRFRMIHHFGLRLPEDISTFESEQIHVEASEFFRDFKRYE